MTVPAVPRLSADALAACRSLTTALPATLRADLPRRETRPASGTTAAWGSPAITLRCGVPTGSPLDEPYAFNDVHWAMHDIGAGRRWTTTDRRVNIAIEVPDRYDSQAELLAGLAALIKRTL